MPPTSPTTWQLIGQLSTIGMSFVFALVIGFFVGLAAGVLNVYRVLQLSNRK